MKRVLAGLMVGITVLVFIYWDLIGYALQQATGQVLIVWSARPVSEFLHNPNFPDSLKAKLRLIDEVRKYAIDSLGLKDTQNYKTLYDQKGEEIMWVVTACEPFQLKPKEWNFPILGSVPYKGFFNKGRALQLKEELEKAGLDVSVRNPGGWSTLGWFTDPILSDMLEESAGDLANLIIHEMSHATIFVKDSVNFNENLASFIGDRGAEKFLIWKYGVTSEEYLNYVHGDNDYTQYVNHMLHGTFVLDSLYQTMKINDLLEEKLKKKMEKIKQIVTSLDTLKLYVKSQPSLRFKDKLPNNAYFMNFKRYQSRQNIFWEEYEKIFGRNLKAYVIYFSDKYSGGKVNR